MLRLRSSECGSCSCESVESESREEGREEGREVASWPSEIRYSAMELCPYRAARCREVLPLVLRSGFWR